MNVVEFFIKKLKRSSSVLKRKGGILNSYSVINYNIDNKPVDKLIKNGGLLIVSIIIIIFTTSFIVFTFKNHIFSGGNIDIGLNKAEENGQVSYPNVTAEDKGIKVVIKGVISDGVRTVMQISVFGITSGKGIPKLGGIQLSDMEGNKYKVSNWGSGDEAAASNPYETKVEFESSPKKSTTLTFSLSTINTIKGNWSITFPIKILPSKEFKTNIIYRKGNVYLVINKIITSATSTVIEGLFENQNWIYSASLSNGLETVFWKSAERNRENIKLYFPTFSSNNSIKLNIVLNDNNQSSFSLNIPASTIKY